MPSMGGCCDSGGGGGGGFISGAALAAILVQNEIAGGPINGSNTVFTAANDFVAGTLTVFLNGDLLRELDDYTVNVSTRQVTLFVVPLPGDKVTLGYIKDAPLVSGAVLATIYIQNEIPAGATDGVNVNYLTSNTFVSGTLQVFLNGQLLRETDDFGVLSGFSGFFMLTPPLTGDNILVSYIKV